MAAFGPPWAAGTTPRPGQAPPGRRAAPTANSWRRRRCGELWTTEATRRPRCDARTPQWSRLERSPPHMANHGSTPAAWTAVVIALAAFCVAGVGLVVDDWVVFWIGIAMLAVAAIVGKVMQAMGMGAR